MKEIMKRIFPILIPINGLLGFIYIFIISISYFGLGIFGVIVGIVCALILMWISRVRIDNLKLILGGLFIIFMLLFPWLYYYFTGRIIILVGWLIFTVPPVLSVIFYKDDFY